MPPSVEYSSLALAIEPCLVQVIFLDSPTIQISAPLGEVTVNEPLILKLASEVSKTVVSEVLVIFTRQVGEGLSGIVQT